MRWPWQPKRDSIKRKDFSILIYRAFDHCSDPLLDAEYILFENVADFLNVCPRPKRYRDVRYDCNRQLIEVLGKLQGYAVGGAIVPWKKEGKKINHAFLIVCCKDRVVRLFDVNARVFVTPHHMQAVKIWL